MSNIIRRFQRWFPLFRFASLSSFSPPTFSPSPSTRLRKGLSALCFLLVFAGNTGALLPTPLPLHPPLLHITAKNGLHGNQVRYGLQDARGIFWLATRQGLQCYHNARFSAHFTSANTVLLPDGRLTTIAQDEQGDLWFGTYGGLVRFSDGDFTTFTRANGLPDNRVTCMLVAPGKRLWFGSWKGLAVYEKENLHPLPSTHGLPATAVSALLSDSSGNQWIGYATDGLWRYDGQNFAPVGQAQGFYRLKVQTLYEDRLGNLWIASIGSGLLRWNEQNKELTAALDVASVLCLQEDHKGRLWAGTSNGLYYRRTDDTWHAITLSPGRPFPVTCLHEDSEQSLWIGTWGNGLWRRRAGTCSRVEEVDVEFINAISHDSQHRLWATTEQGILVRENGTWSDFTASSPLLSGAWNDLFEDQKGSVWIGGQGQGLLRFDGTRLSHFSPAHHLPPAEIHTLTEAPDGTLWLGTAAGLVAFDGNQFLPYGTEAGLPHPSVYALSATRQGDLWIGTGEGLALRHNGRITTRLSAAELPGPVVRALAPDRDDGLWIATSGGLAHLRKDQLRIFTRADGLPHDNIRDLALDARGRLWIATSGGLALFDQRRFTTFTKADGLTSDLLYSLHIDAEGGVWIGSLAGGAVRYDGQNFFRLTSQEGLPSNSVRHIFEDAEGHIWLATDKGLTRYHRDALTPVAHPLATEIILIPAVLLLLALGVGVYLWKSPRNSLFLWTLCLLSVLCPPLWAESASPPCISGLQTSRRPGTLWIDLTYQLQGPTDQDITVIAEASADGGESYDIPVLSILGDVGLVQPGSSRSVLWDAGADAPELFTQPWQVRLTASLSPPLPPDQDMVLVPAGPFPMGSALGPPHEKPVHEVFLKAYWIDRFETTNRAFMRFVQATGYQTAAEAEGKSLIYIDGGYQTIYDASWRAPAGPSSYLVNRLGHPVVHVNWDDARAYCLWAKKRLPTEAEWEKAARGTDQRTFPWGEKAAGTGYRYRANYGTDQCCHESDQDGFLNTAPVGSFPLGLSPYGLYDMAGNVWEWTRDWYGKTYYASSPTHDPPGAAQGSEYILRGGSWISYPVMLRTTYRGRHTPDMRHNYGGFRCARDE